MTRAEALARFAPVATRARNPGTAREVRCLISTDLLSEGVNLQDASVLVHLDLPWTPARLEQRVGRLARLGSPHARVTVYSFAAPASAEALLAIGRRLDEKRRITERTIGFTTVPASTRADESAVQSSIPAAATRLEQILHRWRDEVHADGTGRKSHGERLLVASVASVAAGWIALARSNRSWRLIASWEGHTSDDPRLVADACAAAGGQDASEAGNGEAAVGALSRWLDRERGALAAGAGDVALAHARRGALTRLANASQVPRSHRAAMLSAATRARNVVLGRLDLASEVALRQTVASGAADGTWLEAVAAIGAGDSSRAGATRVEGDVTLAVLILLSPCS